MSRAITIHFHVEADGYAVEQLLDIIEDAVDNQTEFSGIKYAAKSESEIMAYIAPKEEKQ